MKFLYNSFKAKKKQIVKVSLSRPTKVKLLTAFDLKKYKQGRTHRYRGGFFEESTIYFRLPADGIWYVVVEKGSHSAPIEVEASVELLPPDKKQAETEAADAPVNNSAPQNIIANEDDAVEEEPMESVGDEEIVEDGNEERPSE